MKLLIANWKMHGSLVSNELYIKKIISTQNNNPNIVMCPPNIYLPQVNQLLSRSKIALGAQNVHFAAKGAYTGEHTVAMLSEFNCKYVIIGHSERREHFAETTESVAVKAEAVANGGLVPIICVGEAVNTSDVSKVLHQQLEPIMALQLSQIIVAYEPIWAIGKQAATTTKVVEVCQYIRNILGKTGKIIYGGSVNPDNIAGFLQQPEVDGALIGGASLDANLMLEMCDIAMKV